MNIAIGSAWRDSAGNLPRYELQVSDLAASMPGHNFRVIAVEGDSRDITPMALANRAKRLGWEVVTCNHGQRKFGSTEDADRMVAMSKVGNAIFNAVKETDDVLVYVESDLVWDADTIRPLIEQVADLVGCYHVIAPMIYSAPGVFYDIWGFRGVNDERFSPFPPYHPSLQFGLLTEVHSVGSCLVMRGNIARRARILNDYCLVGWCERARALGARIAVDTRYKVRHP